MITRYRPPVRPTGNAPPSSAEGGYVDEASGTTRIHVMQGEYKVSDRPDVILATVLGSCIAACIRDPMIGWGGMNHFLLPAGDGEAGQDIPKHKLMSYGTHAMELLINSILSRGGRRDRLEVKVFGGANMMSGLAGIGHRNAEFIEKFLAAEGLPIAAKDLRGQAARQLHYAPVSGRVRQLLVQDDKRVEVFRKETVIKPRLAPVDDELF